VSNYPSPYAEVALPLSGVMKLVDISTFGAGED
jgi:hypothetical protein